MKKILSITLTTALCIGLLGVAAMPTSADVDGSVVEGEIVALDDNVPVEKDDAIDALEGFELKFTDTITEIKSGKSHRMTTNIGEVGLKNRDITWKSLNPMRLKVGRFGKITGKAVGKAKVQATFNGQTVVYTVQVVGKKLIGLDAGHQRHGMSEKEPVGPGSSEMKAKVSSGTTGDYTRVPEYEVNLKVAKALRKELRARGYDVVMTHSKLDVSISNIERAKKINDAGADICLRIHCNGIENSSVKGALMMCSSSSNPYVGYLYKKSYKLNQCILDKYIESTGLQNRGIQITDNLTGTNWSKVPTALVEMGFMSNESDDRFLVSDAGQAKIVIGLANGIDSYFGY